MMMWENCRRKKKKKRRNELASKKKRSKKNQTHTPHIYIVVFSIYTSITYAKSKRRRRRRRKKRRCCTHGKTKVAKHTYTHTLTHLCTAYTYSVRLFRMLQVNIAVCMAVCVRVCEFISAWDLYFHCTYDYNYYLRTADRIFQKWRVKSGERKCGIKKKSHSTTK